MTNQFSQPISTAWTDAAITLMLQSLEDLLPRKQSRAWLSSASAAILSSVPIGTQDLKRVSKKETPLNM